MEPKQRDAQHELIRLADIAIEEDEGFTDFVDGVRNYSSNYPKDEFINWIRGQYIDKHAERVKRERREYER